MPARWSGQLFRTPELVEDDGRTRLARGASLAAGSSRFLTGPCHSAGRLEGIPGRRVETRISLLKEPLGLYNPGCGFAFTAEAWDRPALATCRRHLDTEGAIAAGR
jgi:hypothetical protein